MTDVKAAMQWLAGEINFAKTVRDQLHAEVIFRHLDSEPQRIAAAREEQREACAQYLRDYARDLSEAGAYFEKVVATGDAADRCKYAPLTAAREEQHRADLDAARRSLKGACGVCKSNVELAVDSAFGGVAPDSTPLADEIARLRERVAEKAEAERDEAVKALRGLRREVSAKLTGRDSEPGEFEKAWQQACAVLAKYPEGK